METTKLDVIFAYFVIGLICVCVCVCPHALAGCEGRVHPSGVGSLSSHHVVPPWGMNSGHHTWESVLTCWVNSLVQILAVSLDGNIKSIKNHTGSWHFKSPWINKVWLVIDFSLAKLSFCWILIYAIFLYYINCCVTFPGEIQINVCSP